MTTEEILTLFGERIVAALKDDIKNRDIYIRQLGPVNASGKLADSIRYEVADGKLRIFGLHYIYYLENGRKPGKAPPRAAIKQWILDKGILRSPKESELNSLAFLIQRKIADKGTCVWEQGGSDLVSGVVNEDLKNDLINEIFQSYETFVIEAFRSSYLPIAA